MYRPDARPPRTAIYLISTTLGEQDSSESACRLTGEVRPLLRYTSSHGYTDHAHASVHCPRHAVGARADAVCAAPRLVDRPAEVRQMAAASSFPFNRPVPCDRAR